MLRGNWAGIELLSLYFIQRLSCLWKCQPELPAKYQLFCGQDHGQEPQFWPTYNYFAMQNLESKYAYILTNMPISRPLSFHCVEIALTIIMHPGFCFVVVLPWKWILFMVCGILWTFFSERPFWELTLWPLLSPLLSSPIPSPPLSYQNPIFLLIKNDLLGN